MWYVSVENRFAHDNWGKKLWKYKLDLVGVQVVRWDRSGTEPAGEYTFLYGKVNENHELGTGFCA
jgi:hypothetical protein